MFNITGMNRYSARDILEVIFKTEESNKDMPCANATNTTSIADTTNEDPNVTGMTINFVVVLYSFVTKISIRFILCISLIFS